MCVGIFKTLNLSKDFVDFPFCNVVIATLLTKQANHFSESSGAQIDH